jgi:toxin ParE1/3/4
MPGVRAQYRLTPEAERDLELIWSHNSEAWGHVQANRYADNLADNFFAAGS